MAKPSNITAGITPDQQRIAAVLEGLTALGGGMATADSLVFEGSRFILPAQYENDLHGAVKFIADYEKNNNTYHNITREFMYRPYDVACAVESTLKDLFGTSGFGATLQSFFGPQPPEMQTVNVGVGETRTVPWGHINFPIFGEEAQLVIGYTRKKGFGVVGEIIAHVPRKYRNLVDGLFKAVENKLRTHSIYKGNALTNPADIAPNFLDVSKDEIVVYSDDVMAQLQAELWTPIEQSELLRSMGTPLKRAVLLEGPYGTGKTLAARLTAQKCVENGWTFLFCKPGDSLNETLETAKLYSPSVVFFEDIDVIGDAGDPNKVSKLLDSFDGITAKGQEVIVVLTTNHKESIQRGMLRPGRLDSIVSINALDQSGIEKLIKALTPKGVELVDIDYAEIADACEGYTPAFVVEAIKRVGLNAASRTKAVPTHYVTSDFVYAAKSMRAHFELYQGGQEKPERNSLEDALGGVVARAVAAVTESTGFVDQDGDKTRLSGDPYYVTDFKVDDEKLADTLNSRS